jgi:AAA15 family ATPase/GTPase
MSAEYSANSVAEGFRKAGMLSRLLETGAIQPGVSGPLFWDEPETNMNPKLMKLFVEILLELSANGQQIILATHDYVLLKWLDLLTDKGKEHHVRFHALYPDAVSKEIKVDSADAFQELTENAIAATFSDLYDHEIDRSLVRRVK